MTPGWHRDPAGRADYRWWDGSRWTTSIASGDVVMFDLEGVPSAPPPDAPTTSDAGSLAPRPSPIVTATVAIVIVVLVIGIVAIVHRDDDRAAADARARARLSDQVSSLSKSLSSGLSGVRGDVDELSSSVDDLSSSAFGFGVSDLSELSPFSDFGSGVEACTLLSPDDVAAAFGSAFHVDRGQSNGPYCFLTTDAVSGGVGVYVETGTIDGRLEDQLLNGAPGNAVPRPLAVGDEAYVTDVYGTVAAIAGKGGSYVMIVVESGGDTPTDDQMAQLLTAAVAHL